MRSKCPHCTAQFNDTRNLYRHVSLAHSEYTETCDTEAKRLERRELFLSIVTSLAVRTQWTSNSELILNAKWLLDDALKAADEMEKE